jgi:hypothetical protein
MRRAVQAAAGCLQLASSSRTAATSQQLFLQQLHSSSSPEASASAAAEPAFAADAEDAKYSASSLNFFDSRLQINEWGAASSIPNKDPAPHLRVGTAALSKAYKLFAIVIAVANPQTAEASPTHVSLVQRQFSRI